MRHIRGWVCAARSSAWNGTVLFGKAIEGHGCEGIEPLDMNGIVPFTRRSETRAALEQLKKRRGVRSARLGLLTMNIGRTEKDLQKLKKERSLIVVADLDGVQPFFGRKVKGCPILGGIPAADLRLNGLKPFRCFSDAEHIAMETHRQAASQVSIASFRLRFVRVPKRKTR
jgi:hypothetical protein